MHHVLSSVTRRNIVARCNTFILVILIGGLRPSGRALRLRPLVVAHVSRKSTLMTDTAGGYMGKGFARHKMVDHSDGEYVRGDAHSSTVESYFATLKRGINGVYHHVSEAHLKRYLAEFDFRTTTAPSLA